MKKIILFAFMLSFASLQAQIDKTKLDQYFDAIEENNKFNGSIAIAEDGKIIYERSLGFADLETQKKNNAPTKFRIGSISKTFTAALILKAADEGRLDIHKSIENFFPKLKNADKITIQDLLNHHSGIFSITDDPDYLTWHTKAHSGAEMLDKIYTYEPAFEPGIRGEYSNSNYVLLTLILENVYGKSFGEILNEEIVQPLGLKNTQFGGKINLKNNEANSYTYQREWVKESETDMSIPLGAGGIISTPADIIKFGEALFAGKIISQKHLENMKTIKDDYGLGIFEIPFYEKKAYGHTGGIDGFSSMWGYFPNEKVSFALTSNGSNFNNNDIAIAILSSVFGKEFEIPSFAQNTADVQPGFTGTFSNSQIGMDISVSEKDGKYFAQATGQAPFPLDKTGEFEFRFEPAGIVMEFANDLKAFTLLQGGGKFLFEKIK